MTGNTENPNKLLTKMECCYLFCERLGISRQSYYDYHRDYIKFKPFGKKRGPDGNPVGRLYRIPYGIAVGIINVLTDCYDEENDPPMTKIREYMTKLPSGMQKST
jgi:hypothetical protein